AKPQTEPQSAAIAEEPAPTAAAPKSVSDAAPESASEPTLNSASDAAPESASETVDAAAAVSAPANATNKEALKEIVSGVGMEWVEARSGLTEEAMMAPPPKPAGRPRKARNQVEAEPLEIVETRDV